MLCTRTSRSALQILQTCLLFFFRDIWMPLQHATCMRKPAEPYLWQSWSATDPVVATRTYPLPFLWSLSPRTPPDARNPPSGDVRVAVIMIIEQLTLGCISDRALTLWRAISLVMPCRLFCPSCICDNDREQLTISCRSDGALTLSRVISPKTFPTQLVG